MCGLRSSASPLCPRLCGSSMHASLTLAGSLRALGNAGHSAASSPARLATSWRQWGDEFQPDGGLRQ